MSQANAVQISKIDTKQFKCATSGGKTYFNYSKNKTTFCIQIKNLTQLGIFNPKLLPEVTANNKCVSINKNDIKKVDLEALTNLNNFFANNKEIKTSFNIPDTVKYSPLFSNDVLRLYLNMEYNTDNVRTAFINKDNNNIVNYSHIDDVYKYFSLGNELELYFTFTISNKDYSNEKTWRVNLKLEQVKYKMTEEIDGEAELHNAQLFVNKKTDTTVNTISLFDIDVNSIRGEKTTFNNQDYTLIKYGDTTTNFTIESIVNYYGLPPKTKFINGVKTDTPDPDRPLKFKLSIEDEKTKEKFREIDNYISTNEKIIKLAEIAKKNTKKYKPLLTEPDEEEEKQKKSYINLKFDKNYNNNEITIKTKFTVNGKSIDIKKIEDLDSIIKYQCVVTPTFRFAKISKNNVTGEWFVTLILTSMNIVPANSNVIYSLEETKEAIVDVSSDEEEDEPSQTVVTTKSSKAETLSVSQNKKEVIAKPTKLEPLPLQTKSKTDVFTKTSKAEAPKYSKIFKAKAESDDEEEVRTLNADNSDSEDEKSTPITTTNKKSVKQIKKIESDEEEEKVTVVKPKAKSNVKIATK